MKKTDKSWIFWIISVFSVLLILAGISVKYSLKINEYDEIVENGISSLEEKLTPSECNDSYDLIIAIKSLPENKSRRDAIRSTWGNVKLINGYNIKRIFILGKSDETPAAENHKIITEAKAEKDILQGNFKESFNNLSYKDYLFLSWFKKSKCSTKFIFKGDDDILLNVFLLKQLLARYEDSISDPLVIGSILRNSPRVTNPESKESLFINKTIN